MDTLLRAGEHATDGRGIPITIDGSRELLQQAMIRLTVPKGRFRLDPGLGSELYKLSGCASAMRGRVAAAYVQEALLPLSGVRAEDVSCNTPAPDVLTVAVTLSVDGERYTAEVRV
ncbi:MAG: histidine kinase [Oscillospiraceae bacterium]|nr:histidine kinase [Oscillospiraceae bacterium]